MKKLFYITLVFLTLIACKEEPKNYVTLSGQITNKFSDSIALYGFQSGVTKTIKINEDGTFKDTLHVKKSIFMLYDKVASEPYTKVFLENDNDINFVLDTKKPDDIVFSGKGANKSKFIKKFDSIESKHLDFNSLFELSKKEFDNQIKLFTASNEKLLDQMSAIDTSFTAILREDYLKKVDRNTRFFDKILAIKNKFPKGTPSPKFVDYLNFKGGNNSLDDYKGKYVYIDLWATWCGPCRAEIPHLKTVENKYHDKNIEFVSISMDAKKDIDTWKEMVIEKQMVGTQLFANENYDFRDAYVYYGIPRFILLDPQGNVVDPNAPRPSDPKLIELLESQNL